MNGPPCPKSSLVPVGTQVRLPEEDGQPGVLLSAVQERHRPDAGRPGVGLPAGCNRAILGNSCPICQSAIATEEPVVACPAV